MDLVQNPIIHKLESEMSGELANSSKKEENLVHLYQEIMQCEEDHAKTVLFLLSEVMTPQESAVSLANYTP